jgi:hypothetical protein
MKRADDIKELLEANMEGEDLTTSDLDRVIFPSGGSTMFTVPNIDVEGGEEEVKEIKGIIIFQKMGRSYWAEAGVSNDPPDCFSTDMVKGTGDPGGSCTQCPHAQFGSAVKQNGDPGKGQACSTKRAMYVLTDEALLPIVINAPSASIKATKKYLLALSTKRFKKMHEVVTKFTLIKKESDGTKYAEMAMTMDSALPPEQIAVIEKYIEGIKPMLMSDADKELQGMADQANAEEAANGDQPVDIPFPTETDAPPDEQAAA